MGKAVFIATDPGNQTEADLNDLVPAVAGVTHWSIGSNGEVAVEYDDARTSPETIEEAFAGLGFNVRHLLDDSDTGAASKGT